MKDQRESYESQLEKLSSEHNSEMEVYSLIVHTCVMCVDVHAPMFPCPMFAFSHSARLPHSLSGVRCVV